MSKFTGDLRIDFYSEAMKARLLDPLVWECDFVGSGCLVTIPAEFISDGATVPRAFWWVMPPWGSRYTRAAILHDYLLQAERPRRRNADRQFMLALRALGASPAYATVVWGCVRAFSVLWRRTLS